MSAGPLRHHYAPVTPDGVVQDFWVPVSVPDLETQEVDGHTCEQVRVVVYETQERMVTAACEYNDHNTPEGIGDVGGLCQSILGTATLCDDDDEPRATVRLCLPDLTHGVLLHELVHASHAVYRWQFLALTDSNPWGTDNEDHAYMLQHLWEQAVRTVRWDTSQHPDGPAGAWLGGGS